MQGIFFFKFFLVFLREFMKLIRIGNLFGQTGGSFAGNVYAPGGVALYSGAFSD